MGKVSICVPTYGKAEYVRQLLDSVFQQTYTDFEVIITDDTQGNEVEQVVKSYQDERIRYYHNPEKLGHIFNWNHAIELAEGEYIKIMFSDDWFTFDDSLEKYVSLLKENQNVGFGFSGSMQVSDDNSYQRMIPIEFINKMKADYRYLFLGNHVGAPSGIIYRACDARFDEQSNWASDLFFYFELLKKNSTWSYLDEALVSIGLHEEQYTHSFLDKDERVYHDYETLFLKYNLIENADRKEYFFKEYLVGYGMGIARALNCNYKMSDYIRSRGAYLWKNKIVDYAKAFIGKFEDHNSGKRRGSKI